MVRTRAGLTTGPLRTVTVDWLAPDASTVRPDR
jgi:hypothetical protein